MVSVGRFLSRAIDSTAAVGAIVVALMMIHITLDVFFRYVFSAPIPGTISIVSYYYMILAAFIPLALAEEKNAHISVEIVVSKLPPHVRRWLAHFSYLLSCIIFSLLTVRTWGAAVDKTAVAASVLQGATRIPVWPGYYFLPIGCGLLALVLLYKFVIAVSGRPSGLSETRADPAQDSQ